MSAGSMLVKICILYSVADIFLPSLSLDPMGLNFDQVTRLHEKRKITLIDVRSTDERFKFGTIPGSVRIPLRELKEALMISSNDDFLRMYRFPFPDKKSILVFYCDTGYRSRIAVDIAHDLGFKNATHYIGGYDEWLVNSSATTLTTECILIINLSLLCNMF